MCDPITMAVITAAGTAAELSATNSEAEAVQESAITQQNIMIQQRNMEMEEENRATALKLTQEKREALQEQSAIRVAAAESGVSGGSTLRNLANVYVQESIDAGSIISLNETQLAQIGVQSQADFTSTRNTINTAESKKSTGLSAALQIGASGASGYASGGGFADGGSWAKSTKAFKNTWSWG